MSSIKSERKLILSPHYVERFLDLEREPPGGCGTIRILPRSKDAHAGAITPVGDLTGAEAMLDFARQTRVSFVGLDCEYRYSRPGVFLKKVGGREQRWHDPRSIVPLLMAIVLAEVSDDGQTSLHRFVVDLRNPDVLEPLRRLLGLPVPFVAHFGQGDLFCCWKLGLPAPETVWDTWVGERSLHLGLFHARYKAAMASDDAEQARLNDEADEERYLSCSLVSTCLRHGIPHAFALSKERLQRSFLNYPDDLPFSREQRDYAVADAEAVARLYPVQVQAALARNALNHLQRVEMDWAVTNARIIWDGIYVDRDLCARFRTACARNAQRLSAELADLGVGNVNSHPDLHEFFRSVGLLDAFRRGDSHSFDDDHLEAAEGRHAAISLIRDLRKITRLQSDKLLSGELVGVDGRLHPDHRVLGAESGRNTMRAPNIGGIGKVFRPLVVPQESATHGIGELDLIQIEVLIAAAYTRDPDLLAMVNGRDVYSAMARRHAVGKLSPEDLALPDEEFKRKFKSLRGLMKVYTLAIIYGITRFGLARQLGVSPPRAAEELDHFQSMFPVLMRALREASDYGAIRGYAELCTGLRRHRALAGRSTNWEANWLRNTPIQGSASVVFKVAGSRLRRRYQDYDARLIMPLHDAHVFECPLVHLEAVAAITKEEMQGAVQEFFPFLNPRVDVNIEHPHCWNKDGKHRSLEIWMDDPEEAQRYLSS